MHIQVSFQWDLPLPNLLCELHQVSLLSLAFHPEHQQQLYPRHQML